MIRDGLRVCKLITLISIIFAGLFSHAALTSDVTAGLAFGSNTVSLTQTKQTITSSSIFDFSYNIYYSAMRSAFFLNFTESLKSNVGELTFTRIGMGARWYLFGFNGDRMVLDSSVEGRVIRPAPFLSLSLGSTTLSVPTLNLDSRQYFNAMSFDLDFRAGIEVPLNHNYYLVAQLGTLAGIPTYNQLTKENLSYQGLNIYAGFKATSF